MSTDKEWENWGRLDPYFGIITDPRFRRDRLDETELEFFFATGREHVGNVLGTAYQRFDPKFAPRSILDFGCGVGRVLLPFARIADRAVGIDVSESMLAKARQHADAEGISNIEYRRQGDLAGIEPGSFDLVHSVMVLQHIDVARGIDIFGQLVAAVAPRGIGAIQLTYAKAIHTHTLGVEPAATPAPPPVVARPSLLRRLLPVRASAHAAPPVPEIPPVANPDPLMLMNSYPLTPLYFHLQLAQVGAVYSEFTNHGGELGLFLFFQKP
jgi:SAM-dependent methyltransferase